VQSAAKTAASTIVGQACRVHNATRRTIVDLSINLPPDGSMGRRPGREPLRNRKTLFKRIRFRLCSRNSRQANQADRFQREKIRRAWKRLDQT
jgi:hypothetical protein